MVETELVGDLREVAATLRAENRVYAAKVCRVAADRLEKSDGRHVVRGEWVRDKKTKWKRRYFCSVCDYYLLSPPTEYCPDCGAKMRGE